MYCTKINMSRYLQRDVLLSGSEFVPLKVISFVLLDPIVWILKSSSPGNMGFPLTVILFTFVDPDIFMRKRPPGEKKMLNFTCENQDTRQCVKPSSKKQEARTVNYTLLHSIIICATTTPQVK